MEEYQKKLATMKALREQSQKNLNSSSTAAPSSPAGSPMKPPTLVSTTPSTTSSTPTSTLTPTPSTLSSSSGLTKTPSHPSPLLHKAVPAFQKTSSSPALNSLTAKSPAASPGGSPTSSPSSSFIREPSSPKPAPPVRDRSSITPNSLSKSNSLLSLPPGNASKPSPLALSSSYTPKAPPSVQANFASTPTTPSSTEPSGPIHPVRERSASSVTSYTPTTPTTAPMTPTLTTPSTPTATPTTPTNGKPQRFNTEVEELRYKLEVETKSRQETERRYQEKVRELAMTKMQLQRSQLAETPTNPKPRESIHHANPRESLPVSDPTRKSTRMSKRVSTKPPSNGSAPRMSMKPATRKSLHVASQLTSLVSEITKIEMAVQAAHAAREEAEERLYDICVEKLVVDGVLKRTVQTLFAAEGCMRTITDPKLSQVRNEIVETIAYVVKECGVEITQQGPAETIGSASVSVPAPPAAPESLGSGRPPPPPPSGAKSLSGTQSIGKSASGSLLEQIRSGKSLRQIDLQRLKEERDVHDKKKRKSIKQLKSLTDTLREALFARADDLLGGDEDSGEEDWDEDWME